LPRRAGARTLAPMRSSVVLLAVAALGAAPLRAQQAPPGRLEGTVTERVSSRSVRAASIALTRLEPEPSVSFTASPDEQGRYRLDSLPAGRYALQLSSPTLDSLELALSTEQVEIVAGETANRSFTLPSGAALRDAVCPGLTLGRGTAVVAGRATDADSDQPLAGARVVVSWAELTVDPSTLKSSTDERAAAVATGPRGEYRLCGVPSGRSLTLQLQHAERAATAIDLTVSDEEGAAVRNLSLSARAAPTMAALDSLERLAETVGVDSVTGELLLTGTASVAGTVRGAGGAPLPGVQVHVRDARGTATTDAEGRYLLASLPAGTQILVARRLGYALAEVPVELRAGARVDREVRLVRAVSLDSIRVTAIGTRYQEFDFNRGANILGKFLTRDQIERRAAVETGDLLARLGGFTVVGHGKVARVFTKRAMFSRNPCPVNVVVDGVQDMGVNDVPPSLVVGLEAYTGATSFSTPYRMQCGAVVIWTTAWKREAAPRTATDSTRAAP
jgi:hypothetical protein